VTVDTQLLAERMSFETFVNCYLTELGTGEWYSAEEWAQRVDPAWRHQGEFVVLVNLSRQAIRVAFSIDYRSRVGRHGLGAVHLQRSGRPWQAADRLEVVLALVRELYSAEGARAQTRAHELELVSRIAQSQQVMARYLETRAHDPALDSDRFIESEQSMLYGHWCHPTPKSRQGMTDWQHASFAPELGGRFQLHYFSVARELVRQRSVLDEGTEKLIAGALGSGEPEVRELAAAEQREQILIPVHPLQVDWLLHQRHVQRWLAAGRLREVGRLGPRFTATSSVRTVYSEDCAFMFKLSIPVRITNSLRFNRRHELFAGLAMSQLLEKLGRSATSIRMIADPAYLTVESPDGGETGFELLLRANPFRRGRDMGFHCIAALVQEPLPHRASRLRTLIEGLALTENRAPRAVSLDWLARYLKCAIEPLIRLYDEHGIALEAHQQNSLLDLSAGYPRDYYFRDNQGFYLSAAHRSRLLSIEPELLQRPELFFEDAVILRRFSYYLVSNQLFSVVHRLGRDGLLDEEVSLAFVKAHLASMASQLTGSGKQLVRALLHRGSLPYKANLLTRVRDVDELTVELEQAVYAEVFNPLFYTPALGELELEVA
jgi:spermidine-citrate ligase